MPGIIGRAAGWQARAGVAWLPNFEALSHRVTADRRRAHDRPRRCATRSGLCTGGAAGNRCRLRCRLRCRFQHEIRGAGGQRNRPPARRRLDLGQHTARLRRGHATAGRAPGGSRADRRDARRLPRPPVRARPLTGVRCDGRRGRALSGPRHRLGLSRRCCHGSGARRVPARRLRSRARASRRRQVGPSRRSGRRRGHRGRVHPRATRCRNPCRGIRRHAAGIGACRAARGRHRGRRRQRRHRDGAPLQDGSGRRRRGVVSRAIHRRPDQRVAGCCWRFYRRHRRAAVSAHRPGRHAAQRGQLSARSVRRIITARCSAAGVEGRISGHSLRVGSAQSLAAAGAGLVEMQQAGRWQSPTMPARYAAGELAACGTVARLRYGTAK